VVTWFTFLPSFVFILAGGPFVESTRQMPALQGPLQAITAAVIGVMVQLAGVFARQTWLPDGWHMLPDFWAFALTGVAAWLLIKKQRSVYEVLGWCVVVGLLVQALR
jgi:chromate transporter